MVDAPSVGINKIYDRMKLAEEKGLEFDEAKERRVYGVEPVTGRDPIFIQASADRIAMIRREEGEARREEKRLLEAAKAEMKVETEALDQSNAAVQLRLAHQRNAELEAQLAAVTGARFPAQTPLPEVPAPRLDVAALTARVQAVKAPTSAAPDVNTPLLELIERARANGITLPRGGRGMTKLAILELITEAEADNRGNEEGHVIDGTLTEGELVSA